MTDKFYEIQKGVDEKWAGDRAIVRFDLVVSDDLSVKMASSSSPRRAAKPSEHIEASAAAAGSIVASIVRTLVTHGKTDQAGAVELVELMAMQALDYAIQAVAKGIDGRTGASVIASVPVDPGRSGGPAQ